MTSIPQSEPSSEERLGYDEVQDAWPVLSTEERIEAFSLLSRADAEELYFSLLPLEQLALVISLPKGDQRSWVRLLAPDDAADFIQAAGSARREELMGMLDSQTRSEVTALLAYAEDEAGGLMSPRYVRVRPEMPVDEALSYVRRQARERLETIYYVYVIESDQRLVGVTSLRELFTAPSHQRVHEGMRKEFISVPEEMGQEQLSRLFAQHELMAIPVVDKDGHMKGIVTLDDIVHVVQEEATEDIQKIGGTEALDAPYLSTSFFSMIKKRIGWLSVLFVGEMLTTTAMAFFEHEIARAIVLALFVPLIISSGGNSGSQASTLVIRAMALGEVRLRQWWLVMRRELASGFVLGCALGSLGFLRIVISQNFSPAYGQHYVLVAMTVAFSLVGVVMFGTLAGSMLPFVLRRLGFDPASASAPFVATLVDVTGLVLYFSIASSLLGGTLL